MSKVTTREELLSLIEREAAARAKGIGSAERTIPESDKPFVVTVRGLPAAMDLCFVAPFTTAQGVTAFRQAIDEYGANYTHELGLSYCVAGCLMVDTQRFIISDEEETPTSIIGPLDKRFESADELKEWADPDNEEDPRAFALAVMVRQGLGYPKFGQQTPEEQTWAERKAALKEGAKGAWVKGLFGVDPEAALYVSAVKESESHHARITSTQTHGGTKCVNSARLWGHVVAKCLRSGPGGELLAEYDDIARMQLGAVNALSDVAADPERPNRGRGGLDVTFRVAAEGSGPADGGKPADPRRGSPRSAGVVHDPKAGPPAE